MSATRFVYFDLGKVILDFCHQRACQQMAEVAGVSMEDVWRVVMAERADGGEEMGGRSPAKAGTTNPFTVAKGSELQQRYETGQIDCDTFHREFCEITRTSSDKDELLLAFSDIFQLNLDVVPLITELTVRNFPRGILSNTCPAHWKLIQNRYTLVRECFSKVILSYEAGSMKPDAGIYEAAIKLAGVAPAEIFFTDDKQENIDGALAAGMDAVLFESGLSLRAELDKREIL